MLKLRKVALGALASAALAVLSLSEIYNMRPFGTGAYLALALTSVPVYVTAPVYMLVNGLFSSTTAELWGYASVTVSVVLLKIIFIRLKRQPPLWSVCVTAAVGFCGFIYAILVKALTPLNVILSALFALLFMIVCYTFMRPLWLRKNRARFTEIELVCGCAVLAATMLALSRPVWNTLAFSYAAAAFASLCALSLSGSGAGIVCAVSSGLGMAMYDLNPAPIAVMGVAAAIAAVFCGGKKLLMPAGFALGFVAAGYLFSAVDWWAVLSAAVGTAAYALIPTKLLKKFKTPNACDVCDAALVSVFNRERRKTGGELSKAAEIFGSMSRVMARATGVTADTGAYADRLLSEVCDVCPYNAGCCARNGEVMEELVAAAIADGHTSVGALPQPVLDNCRCMGQLIGKTNGFVDKSKEDEVLSRAYLTAANLIANQLGGAEGIMNKLGSRLEIGAKFDREGAKKINDELVYDGQDCRGAVVLDDGGEKEVSLVVSEDTFDKNKALNALKKVYRRPFFFLSADGENSPEGYVSARFKSGSVLDVVFGVSTVSKDAGKPSGDTHSFAKVGAGGFMMAISDGMGSGESAHDISDTAVSLVENYYRAGFDSKFVLASVNKFLNVKRDESFSAMDILVLDLTSCCGDIIKVGCPPTIVKRGGETASIGGGSLPLGAVEELTPYSESVKFCEGDLIIMMSDGVADCFSSGEAERVVANLDTINPQTAAGQVLERALENIGGVQRDDMTVIAGRIYRGI